MKNRLVELLARLLIRAGECYEIWDRACLVAFERFAQRVERAIGLDCFRLSDICGYAAYGFFLWAIYFKAKMLAALGDESLYGPVDIVLDFLGFAWGASRLRNTPEQKEYVRRVRRGVLLGVANPNKINSGEWNARCVLWGVFLLVNFVNTLAFSLRSRAWIWQYSPFAGLVLASLYLRACDPLGPAAGKANRMRKSFFQKRAAET